MKLIISILAVTILSGCAAPGRVVAEPGTPYHLSAADIVAVQKGVRERLKDPESSRFGGMGASKRRDGLIYVCGVVNARNSFGGYTGSQPFIGLLQSDGIATRFGVFGIGGTDIETSAVLGECRDAGIGA